MISLEQATKIANLHIEESRMDFKNNHPDDDLVLVEVIEFTNGWLFFFSSIKYQETKNVLDRLIGLGPVIVDNTNGIVFQAGSYGTVSEWIDEFNGFLRNREQ
jgi:hypothetical protein